MFPVSFSVYWGVARTTELLEVSVPTALIMFQGNLHYSTMADFF